MLIGYEWILLKYCFLVGVYLDIMDCLVLEKLHRHNLKRFLNIIIVFWIVRSLSFLDTFVLFLLVNILLVSELLHREIVQVQVEQELKLLWRSKVSFTQL